MAHKIKGRNVSHQKKISNLYKGQRQAKKLGKGTNVKNAQKILCI